MHIYRWDLDRTYLDTDIASVRGMIRTALERASQKRNVPGAAALLRALIDYDDACRVFILSGSPVQMREVLEEKLALDGVRFDRLVLKDNLGNLRRGRFRAIRGQIGYKLPALLAARGGLGGGVSETLFGDDTEVDALVYTLYAEAVAGRVSEDELTRVMEAGGAYPDAVQDALRYLRQIGHADCVEDIFIHADQALPLATYHRLGRRVIPVWSWFQAALVLWQRGRVDAGQVAHVARAVLEDGPLTERGLVALAQDIVRRRHLAPERLLTLVEEADGLAPVAADLRRALDRLGPLPEAPLPPARPDWIGFLRAVH